LEVRDGGVWLRGRRVDVIARMFLIEYLVESPDSADLFDPIVGAVERGEVAMFTPFDSELFACKGNLAMLSDERNRGLFTAAELSVVDRLLPWTRYVGPGPVTLEDGRAVDLYDYAVAHQRELVLKPTALHGGQGVVMGWHPETTPARWRATLADVNPHVIQRRVRPESELFLDDNGNLVPGIVAWGVFTGMNGYAGMINRVITADPDTAVINLDHGALVAACFTTAKKP
jgi:hypothetical protein